jgi:4-hydroxy-tetrahydrodipicolinate synthase
MARAHVSGVLPVFQTPFDEHGEIDFEALRHEITWLLDEEADGVVFGRASEILRLSSFERDTVAAAACEYVGARGATVIAVGAESTKVALVHARHAHLVGASAVIVTPPALHRGNDEELFRHFMAIGEEVDLPIIMEDLGGHFGPSPSLELHVRLQRELGDRCMFAFASRPVGPRLSELVDATDGQAIVFDGTGGSTVIDSFRRGVVGVMPAAGVAGTFVALWGALLDLDLDRAYAIAGPLALMASMQGDLDSVVAVQKHLLVSQDIIESDAMRGPLGSSVDDTTVSECGRLMQLLREALDDDEDDAESVD